MVFIDKELKKRSYYYGLGALVIIAGILCFIGVLITSIFGITKSFQQVIVPSSSNIILDKPGKYIIYYEYRSVVGNELYSTEALSISGLKCTLTNKLNKSNIPLYSCVGNSKYNINGRKGESFLQFNIKTPGTYQITANYGNGKDGSKIVLAVGKSFGRRLAIIIIVDMMILVGTIIIGTLIIARVFIKRKKYTSKI